MNALRVWSKADEVRMWLLCLPPGGGDARLYKEWAGRLPESIGVAALELPGRGGRKGEPWATSSEAVVDEYADAVTPLLERPVMLYGHSMGAVLALDLAHALRARHGAEPLALVTAASEPPERRAVEITSDATDDELVRWLRALGGTHEELLGCPEYLAELLPVLRADLGLLERRPRRALPPLGCPVHVYLGARDPMVDGPGAQRGWAAHTTREQPPRTFPGGHFFVSESTEQVLAALAEDADAAVGGRLLRPR
ncbi:thioesterase II family protein [Streptomyces longispororuber]|uniref:thioesterase II family protein n=1 Tax=Streptomyces longispororuber TaxID=68230 RepID=UPI00210C5970|nr:alpha/beta fold hydrolase [Streptomyces longispororuber]MCQ4206656.1 alpha/beta fold hydrolase [Streptomyces longispororuber]